MEDIGTVHQQYLTEERLEARRGFWQPGPEGDPATAALDAIVASGAHDVLELGCGTGAFAARLRAAGPIRVLASDQSERMVAVTRQRGVEARVLDATDLPMPDDSYDAVAALWMLYHVADRPRALSEVRRVLRPDGVFVAITIGSDHLADLRVEAGGAPVQPGFSSENGEEQLRAHFSEVVRSDFRTRAVFDDRAAALTYLDTGHDDVRWELPEFDTPREYAGHVTMFVCRD
ncbi:class I SAM-dependent methyltransferase [Nocardioides daejeonensis]|uniref:class I SAM-dependent methyltransferase n=1 Tax=Nocardioides daejeonensis TaxID=1046556 RepID=UPI000D748F75|nr:class I SAM-dependent methyltransferase [Nocardioides daejeonensis]